MMKKYRHLFLALLFLQVSCKSQTKKINGISFVASRDAINQKHIQPIIKAQSNYVALMPFGFITNLSSPEIKHNSNRQWFGETEKGIAQYAAVFKKNKINLMIKPQIWVWNGEYTGFIKMNSEERWKQLEDSYTSFILTYAKTAAKLNAAVFCIGTELEQFALQRPAYWKGLIKKIRAIYKGKLTYAANWDEYKRIAIWSDLDYIGIDAYFPITDKKTPTVNDFEQGWQSTKEEIKQVQQKYNKSILFTEFGYRSVDFTGKEPWRHDQVSGGVNLEAQVNGLQAIYNQFWNEEWFAGGFIWKWFHEHDKVGGKENNRFTPQNKPAEKLLEQLYGN